MAAHAGLGAMGAGLEGALGAGVSAAATPIIAKAINDRALLGSSSAWNRQAVCYRRVLIRRFCQLGPAGGTSQFDSRVLWSVRHPERGSARAVSMRWRSTDEVPRRVIATFGFQRKAAYWAVTYS
jgi:hypothetical protein